MLPALTAVLAGALVAGAATMLASPGGRSTADPTGYHVALTDSQTPDASGGLSRPKPGDPSGTSSTEPTTPDAPTSSEAATPPPASSTPAPPASSETDPPPAPASSSPDTSQQSRVVTLVNMARQQAGCGPIAVDVELTAAAQNHSADMSNRDYFSHTTPEGVSFDQRIRNAGYSSPGAENIAKGARNAEDVMRMWMESSGHRANILNCDLNTIGVGLARGGFYWTQDFGY